MTKWRAKVQSQIISETDTNFIYKNIYGTNFCFSYHHNLEYFSTSHQMSDRLLIATYLNETSKESAYSVRKGLKQVQQSPQGNSGRIQTSKSSNQVNILWGLSYLEKYWAFS